MSLLYVFRSRPRILHYGATANGSERANRQARCSAVVRSGRESVPPPPLLWGWNRVPLPRRLSINGNMHVRKRRNPRACNVARGLWGKTVLKSLISTSCDKKQNSFNWLVLDLAFLTWVWNNSYMYKPGFPTTSGFTPYFIKKASLVWGPRTLKTLIDSWSCPRYDLFLRQSNL